MPIRHRVLLGIVLLAFAAFVVSSALDPNWSKGDVAFLVVFAVFFVALVFLTLIRRGNETVEGHRGLPRGFWGRVRVLRCRLCTPHARWSAEHAFYWL
jgi:hypothetical protein